MSSESNWQEKLKWGLIRHWPWGYRLTSRLEQLLRHRDYDDEVAAARSFYGQFIESGGLCFDIGANHGMRSEVFLALGARVVAVEPQPHCIQRLRARFGPDRNFHLVPSAVGAESGEATLHLGKSDLISTLSEDWLAEAKAVPELSEIGWEGSISVPVTTLEALIAKHGLPDFCKIDVEGFELEVLRGLRQPLPMLSLEYTKWRTEPTLDCIAHLQTLGDYRFNVSELETMRFGLEEWVSAGAVCGLLSEIHGEQEFGYGDVYARWEGASKDGSS